MIDGVSRLRSSPSLAGPRYNIAPGQEIAAVLNEPGRPLELLRWGLIPAWAKDEKVGYKMIMLHQTGPAAFRARIGTLLVRRGYAAADGWIHQFAGAPGPGTIETPEEEDVFRILGMEVLPLERRVP